MYKRALFLPKFLSKKSHFLLGPRAVGKSHLVKSQLPEAQIFDLLDNSVYDSLLRNPHLLASEIKKPLVVIDEIQKIPRLLDEVHRLIEDKKIKFLLTGSSARKLRRGGANLLAGRARSLELFPLTSREITDFDLVKYCNIGGMPMIYDSDNPWLDLKEYSQLYLKEEIIAEAVVRKVDHYARFLDVIGSSSGRELNFQKIASDSSVPIRTVDNFVEILKDTLLAYELAPFQKTKKRKAISKSKIYLFDIGVANYFSGRKNIELRSDSFGVAFEHFIMQEIRAYLSYHQVDLPMSYWRTQVSQYEVDCILGDEIAIEIKSSSKFSTQMLKGLKALQEEKKVKKFILVSNDPVSRNYDGVLVMPYTEFLEKLWGGHFV